jgi:hypothetical protein
MTMLQVIGFLTPVILGYLLVIIAALVVTPLVLRRGNKPLKEKREEFSTSEKGSKKSSARAGKNSRKRRRAKSPTWTPVDEPDAEIIANLQNEALNLLFEEKFAELEHFIRDNAKERLRNGSYKLRVFYQAFENFADRPHSDNGKNFPALFDSTRRWKQSDPESLYSHISLCCTGIGHAWHEANLSTGSAVGDDEEQAKRFRTRLNEAFEVLEMAPESSKKNPHFYAAALELGIGLRFDYEEMETIFLHGQRLRPEYEMLYVQICTWLLPRWHGQKDTDWPSWLSNSVSRMPEDDGDALFARVALEMIERVFYPEDANPFQTAGLKWDRVRRGGEILLRRFPESTSLPSQMLKAAHLAESPGTTRNLINRMEHRADPTCWPDMARLQEIETWAQSQSP